MDKFTPGPWCVETPMENELTIVQAGKETYDWNFIASCNEEMGIDPATVAANAQLIAAAPELLAALEALLKSEVFAEGEGHASIERDGDEDILRQVHAAINKARGIQ